MKKLLTIIFAASVGLLVSCGPSAEEKQRVEQARLDSIQQATEQAMQDSINASMEQARQDSLNQSMQDSLAALQSKVEDMSKPKPKPKPKTIEEKKNEEVKKATQGRG